MALPPRVLERHKRHILVHDIGGVGVQKLSAASVSIVGAGALGGPCAMYLAATGVGEIHIFDDDRVDRSNLSRQVQFSETDIGRFKADRLTDKLRAMNPEIKVVPYRLRVSEKTNVPGTILIDATDNYSTRFALNRIAHKSKRALVSGAASVWSGQVSVFASGIDADMPCYQCWVPEAPELDDDCNTMGVVGPVTGMVGTRMALEAMKLISGAGDTLKGRLWILDGRSGESRTVKLRTDSACKTCGPAISL